MLRKSIIAGNWKMNGHLADSKEKVTELVNLLKNLDPKADLVICPPYTLISELYRILNDKNINLGGQDSHFATKGAHTGDISPAMLKDLGCKYVILGHSERRVNHQESNEIINKKVKAAIGNGLIVILCIGESLEEKNFNKTLDVITKQIEESLPKTLDSQNLVIAYEPIWAIGTGLVPNLEDIKIVHAHIRQVLTKVISKEQADKIRILYGGSLKADNSKEILELEDVDGGLIGGASLIPADFVAIIKNSK
ncbi:Triosephosphate isomerase [Candidatus Hepatincolaceae symbiont of Richtersius coronifer]